MAKEEVILDFKVEAKDSITSIENLTKANKALREERKKLDLQSKDGKARAAAINKELDKNTEKIKDNSSALEKQRLNIGNYGSALDRLIPGLSGATSGIGNMTKGATAFGKVGIILIITTLATALGSVISYLKGTEEGQKQLNKIMNIGNAVFGKFSDIVQFVGKVVFENLLKGGEAVLKFLQKWVPGFEAATDVLSEFFNIDTANQISVLQDRQIELNRELITRRAILKEEIEAAKVRAESTKDAKLRKEALDEAVSKINELSEKEKELAQLQSDIAVKQGEQANNDIAANDAIEEGKARINELERERLAQLKEISTKQLALNEKEKADNAKKIQDLEKQAEIQSEIDRAKRIRDLEESMKADEETLQSFVEKSAKIEETSKSVAASRMRDVSKVLKASIAANEKETDSKKKEADIQKIINDNKIQGALAVFRVGSGLAKEGTVLAKSLGIAQATIDTYIAANKAFAAGGGVPFGAVLATLTVAAGLANVAKISGITAAAGGGSFMTKGPQLMMVGDNPGGVERVDVTPISGKGKTTVGGGMIKLAGGGSVVANGMSSKIDQNFGSTSSPKVVLTYSEFKEFMGGVDFKESLTTA